MCIKSYNKRNFEEITFHFFLEKCFFKVCIDQIFFLFVDNVQTIAYT